jgi:hypothetical protein
LTSLSSTVSTSSSTEYPLTFDQLVEVNHSSLVSCLPRWASKIIEAAGADDGDASSGWRTRSQKKHANIFLMTHVLETSDLVSYLDVEGRPEWEQAM